MPRPSPLERRRLRDRVYLRASETELTAWRKAAARAGLTLSEWIRALCAAETAAKTRTSQQSTGE